MTDKIIIDAIALFPPTFGLRAYPGLTFRISPTSSYVDDGRVTLYTQVLHGDKWGDFAKGSATELRPEVVDAPPPPTPDRPCQGGCGKVRSVVTEEERVDGMVYVGDSKEVGR